MRGSDEGETSAQLITIYWRDIPAQVTARTGRRKVSVQLSDRFQIAIDRAAARAGKETTDEYLAEWRRVASPCGPDLALEADEASTRLEAQFPPELLRSLVASGGVRETIEKENRSS